MHQVWSMHFFKSVNAQNVNAILSPNLKISWNCIPISSPRQKAQEILISSQGAICQRLVKHSMTNGVVLPLLCWCAKTSERFTSTKKCLLWASSRVVLNGRNQFEVRKVTPFKYLGAGRTLLAQKMHGFFFVLPERLKNQLFCSRGSHSDWKKFIICPKNALSTTPAWDWDIHYQTRVPFANFCLSIVPLISIVFKIRLASPST